MVIYFLSVFKFPMPRILPQLLVENRNAKNKKYEKITAFLYGNILCFNIKMNALVVDD